MDGKSAGQPPPPPPPLPTNATLAASTSPYFGTPTTASVSLQHHLQHPSTTTTTTSISPPSNCYGEAALTVATDCQACNHLKLGLRWAVEDLHVQRHRFYEQGNLLEKSRAENDRLNKVLRGTRRHAGSISNDGEQYRRLHEALRNVVGLFLNNWQTFASTESQRLADAVNSDSMLLLMQEQIPQLQQQPQQETPQEHPPQQQAVQQQPQPQPRVKELLQYVARHHQRKQAHPQPKK